ncbi:MAG: tetratricopeptide repeat protein [Bacteriovoracaceae bacterium]|nr:tetratricopeptide repeat protein [Bacteriovoracaceae bacterium]
MKTKLLIFVLLFVSSNAYSKKISKIYANSYAFEKSGNYQKAIAEMMPLLKKFPKSYTANLRLGWLFLLKNKLKNSFKHYEKALKSFPASINPYLGLIKILMIQKKYVKAEVYCKGLTSIDYYNYSGNLYYISALIAQKKYSAALKVANRMLDLYPGSADFLINKGIILYWLNDTKNAKWFFNNVLYLFPKNPTALYYLSLYKQKGKKSKKGKRRKKK